jgi:hypothetical protein
MASKVGASSTRRHDTLKNRDFNDKKTQMSPHLETGAAFGKTAQAGEKRNLGLNAGLS